MDVSAYLKRIDYDGPLAPSADTLRRLQVANLLAVPFENLSIHSGEPIILEDEALFAKIVTRRRGGFCYELNGLFAAVLRGLGFDVAMLSAQVANPEGELGPEFDHMALLVRSEQRWLADVGFGDSFLEPLRVDERGEQVQGNRAYRIVPEGERLQLMQSIDRGPWKVQYSFSLNTYEYADYEAMCRFHQTSPDSHFTRGRICSRATPNGRMTLSDMRFIETEDGERRERLLTNEAEYDLTLREYFGIRVQGLG